MTQGDLLAPKQEEAGAPAVLPAVPPTVDPATAYLASLAPGSRRAMASALCIVGGLLVGQTKVDDPRSVAWHRLTIAETAAIRAHLIARGWAPKYCNKILTALRGVLRAAWRLDLMSGDVYARAIDLDPIRGGRVLAGRDASQEEIRAIFDSCRRDASRVRGARDAAILALAYGAGLRRDEIARVPVEAFDPDERTVRVIGKGNRERIVPMAAWAAELVREWIALRGSEPGALVGKIYRGKPSEELSGQAVYQAIVRRVALAGIESLRPHDFRRTLATELLERSGDLEAVQQILGHASISTTQLYLRRTEKRKRAAASVLPDPTAPS